MIVTRALLAALALCAACASLSGSEEDVWYYKGKTQAEWAEELKKSKNEEAWKAFDRFGRHGAYELLQLIQQGDAQCRERALSKIRPDYLSVPKNQDLVKSFLRDENPAVRKAGIQLLAPLVAKDEQWIMHLNDLRKDANGEVAAAAEQALKPVMSRILFNDAQILMKQSKPEEALVKLKEAEQLEPKNEAIRKQRAQVEEAVTAKINQENARKEREKAETEAKQKLETLNRKVNELLATSEKLIQQKEYDKASALIIEVQKLVPDDPRPRVLSKKVEDAKFEDVLAKAKAENEEVKKLQAKIEADKKRQEEEARQAAEEEKKKAAEETRRKEAEARAAAEAEARKKADEAAKKAEAEAAEAKRLSDEKARRQTAELEAEKRRNEEAALARQKAEAEKKRVEEETAKKALEEAEKKKAEANETAKKSDEKPAKQTDDAAAKKTDSKDTPKKRRVGSENID